MAFTKVSSGQERLCLFNDSLVRNTGTSEFQFRSEIKFTLLFASNPLIFMTARVLNGMIDIYSKSWQMRTAIMDRMEVWTTSEPASRKPFK